MKHSSKTPLNHRNFGTSSLSHKTPTTQKPRGLSFAEGQNALTPQTEEYVDYYGYSAEDSKRLYEKNAGKSKNTIHDNLLEGKNRDGTFDDIYGKYDAGTATSLMELWSMVGAYVTCAIPEGAKHYAKVAAKLDVLGVVQFGADMSFEAGVSKDGKTTLKAKVNLANSVTIGHTLLGDFGAQFKATFGGAYEVSSVGDDVHECFKLMQIGIMAAIRADAAGPISADDKEKAAAKTIEPTDEKGMTLLGALGWAWKRLRSTVLAVVAPDDHAEYRLESLVNAMWDGDSGESYDQRLAEAMAEMDGTDMVAVKKSKAAKLGSSGEVLGNELAFEGGFTGVTTTTLNRDNAATGGERKQGTQFRAHGSLDLAALGAKGLVAYQRTIGAQPAQGELELELEAELGAFADMGIAIGATLFKKVYGWFASEKDPEKSALQGLSLGTFTSVMAGVSTQLGNAVAAAGHSGQGHGSHDASGDGEHEHPPEVTVVFKWGHSPWVYEGMDIKLVRPAAKAGLKTPKGALLGLESGVDAKVGQVYAFKPSKKDDAKGGH